MPNEVCSSYRSPLIGGTLQLHSTHSRISLSLLTCNMWGIKTDKIQNHSFDSQPQTHDPVLNSLHLNTIHMPFLQTSVISCLIYTMVGQLELISNALGLACLPPGLLHTQHVYLPSLQYATNALACGPPVAVPIEVLVFTITTQLIANVFLCRCGSGCVLFCVYFLISYSSPII